MALAEGPDLLIVDLDVRPETGLKVISAARGRSTPAGQSTPVILLAGDQQRRADGMAAGADEALATPPSYHDLQAAVIRTLSRPQVAKSET